MKFRVFALAVLVVLGIMPAAQATQPVNYRGPMGDASLTLTVVKRDSGRRFLVAESVRNLSLTCDGGGTSIGGTTLFGLSVRLRDDRPFRIDLALGGDRVLIETHGDLGWRRGQGTFSYSFEQNNGNLCTSGELDWTVERVVEP